ncbi:MAG: GNAT family N-acetyltransferase [Methylophilus sp.]
MEIELRETNSPSDFSSTSLRDQAKVSTKTPITKHYVAMSEGIEVAFVALDMPEHKSYLCVYELLVEPKCRGHGHGYGYGYGYGYGTAIINHCQQLAIQGGFKTISLIPRPIEAGGTEQKLRAWYSKLGFSQSPNQSDLLEIVFVN